jgi:hypothetical protein
MRVTRYQCQSFHSGLCKEEAVKKQGSSKSGASRILPAKQPKSGRATVFEAASNVAITLTGTWRNSGGNGSRTLPSASGFRTAVIVLMRQRYGGVPER